MNIKNYKKKNLSVNTRSKKIERIILVTIILSMTTMVFMPPAASYGSLLNNFLEINNSEEAQYSLDSGVTWTESTDDLTGDGPQPEGNFIDLVPTCTGYAFGVTDKGEIWYCIDTFATTDPYDEWILIIDDEDGNPYPTETVVAGDTDGSHTYWVLDIQGGIYRIISNEDTTAEIWGAAVGDAGDATDFVHLEYVSGEGTSARLYALYKTGDNPIRYSTNGGTTWANLGGNTGATDPIALSVHNENCIYILEVDGDIRYSTNSGSTWTTLTGPYNGGVGPYYDETSEFKDIEVYNHYVYIVNTYGRIWYFNIDSGGTPQGSTPSEVWGYTNTPHALQASEPIGIAGHLGDDSQINYNPTIKVTKTGPATAEIGDTVTYYFNVSHDTGSDCSPVTMTSVIDNVSTQMEN
jgi:hypothetical protein